MNEPRQADWQSLLYSKLSALAPLSREQFAPLGQLLRAGRGFNAGDEIQHASGSVAILQAGWCYRYCYLEDGRRVVFGFLLPGDVIRPDWLRTGIPTELGAATDGVLASVAAAELVQLRARHPAIDAALSANESLDHCLLANQVFRLARLSAYERVSHLLLELYDRLNLTGGIDGEQFLMPLTQGVVADALGLSNFHVSRTLTRLRSEGLVEVEGRTISLTDVETLTDACEYAAIPRRSAGSSS